MSERWFRIVAGLCASLFLAGATVFGVRVALGALTPRYQVEASFPTAGQGLQKDSDVKINGVDIGKVRSVALVDGRALVRMDIEKDERIPVDASATIRPKTLFGEKFVDIDPGDHEQSGPFLGDEGRIEETVGGFDLERVLARLYPILQAVEPEELAVVLDTLAEGGRGQGEAVNRQIRNFAVLAEIQARHDADVRQFLDDFAALSDELADRADALVGAARDLNVALPPLNARGDELATVLDQAARLSTDVADVLIANEPFQRKAVTEGGKAIQVLFEKRARIAPLVTGLRQFFQVLAEVSDLPADDGTVLAAVKFITGEDCPGGRNHCAPGSGGAGTSGPAATGGAGGAPAGPAGTGPTPRPPLPLPVPTTGAEAVTELLGGFLR